MHIKQTYLHVLSHAIKKIGMDMIYLPIFNFWGYIFSKYQQFITIWLYRSRIDKRSDTTHQSP